MRPLKPSLLLPLLALATSAVAQVTPFFGSFGVAAFDPEIGYVHSGVITDVQGTVSADRKYVTITTESTQTNLLALNNFAFQTTGPLGGLVGGAGVAGSNSILDRPGVTRLDQP